MPNFCSWTRCGRISAAPSCSRRLQSFAAPRTPLRRGRFGSRGVSVLSPQSPAAGDTRRAIAPSAGTWTGSRVLFGIVLAGDRDRRCCSTRPELFAVVAVLMTMLGGARMASHGARAGARLPTPTTALIHRPDGDRRSPLSACALAPVSCAGLAGGGARRRRCRSSWRAAGATTIRSGRRLGVLYLGLPALALVACATLPDRRRADHCRACS